VALDDAQWLRSELLKIAREGEARIGEASQFGQKYGFAPKVDEADE
jgi:hypothetical protein